MTKSIVAVILLMAVTVIVAVPVQDDRETQIQRILQANPRLEELGSVDGKTFFSDHTNTHTWESSIAYCAINQLKHAHITSQAQIDFLATKFSIIGPTYYWTAEVDMAARRALAFHCSSATSCDLISTDISYNYWAMCEL